MENVSLFFKFTFGERFLVDETQASVKEEPMEELFGKRIKLDEDLMEESK